MEAQLVEAEGDGHGVDRPPEQLVHEEPGSIDRDFMMPQAAREMEAAMFQDWEDWTFQEGLGQPKQKGARCRVVGQLFQEGRPQVPRQSMDFRARWDFNKI